MFGIHYSGQPCLLQSNHFKRMRILALSLQQAVCDTIALPDICCTEYLPRQRHLLATVLAIIDKAGEESNVHSFTLFYVVIHVMALQPQGSLDQEVLSDGRYFM